jgi:nickel-dependent lactate racemase
MPNSDLDRRSFLGCLGALGCTPLIGTAMAAGPHQPTTVPALKGSAKSVVIPTHEFAGDLDERLDFPADWEINVMDMAGHNAPVLTPRQLAEALDRPIGSKPLRALAEGKKTVVVTFDDLTRTTPTYTVTPWVVGELKAAGIKDENILFLSSYGTHRAMTALEIQKKIGKEIAARYAWMNHNTFDNVKDVGETTFKNRVRLNQTFLAADLKICLSGIKVHQDAGYGGGAKAIMPGVAALPTIEYNHRVILRQTKTAGPVRIFKNEMRLDMIEAARMAKVDFTVQIMYNQKLRPTHIFSGDIVDAHHAGVRVAARHYRTPTLKDADVVVANGYPQNAQAFHAQRWIQYSVREGGTGVLIVQHPLALDPVHFLNNRVAGLEGAGYFDLAARRLSGKPPKNTALIVYSKYTDRTQMNNYPSGTKFCDTWEDVIKTLQSLHKGSVRVAVYPYGGMQHQEIDLDE